MAVVLGPAATLDDDVMHGLAGDGLVPGELAGGEVAGRQAAGLVDDIDQHIGAVLAEGLADRIVDEGFGEGPSGLLERLGLGDIDLGVGRLDGDKLDPFRAEHRAESAAAAGAKPRARILHGDVGGGQFHFARRADGDHRAFVAKSGIQFLHHLIIAAADKLGLFENRNPLSRNLQAVPLIRLGQTFDNQRLHPVFRQHLGGSSAGVGLFDGPGERALGPAGETARVGRLGAGEQARGDHQFVVGSERVAGRFHLGGNHGGSQSPAAKAHPSGRNLFDARAQIGHIHTKNFISHFSLPHLCQTLLRGSGFLAIVRLLSKIKQDRSTAVVLRSSRVRRITGQPGKYP
ncbi:MAG: hypothetical protein ACD_75C02507G0002 [uncultured bacterium]|nr:MAG: hypothetical protein ACD_75C02507G0002 [uncultured bacterium]